MVENIEYLSSRSEHSENPWESPVSVSTTLLQWACPKNYVVILTPKSWNAMEILMTGCIFISKFNSARIPCSYSGIQALFPSLFLDCCIILDTSFPSVFLVYGMVSLTTFGWSMRVSRWKLLQTKTDVCPQMCEILCCVLCGGCMFYLTARNYVN